MGEERYKRKIPGTDYKDTYHRFVVLYVTFISGRALLYIHLYTYMSVRSRLSNPLLYSPTGSWPCDSRWSDGKWKKWIVVFA